MRQFVLLTDRWKGEQLRKDRRSGEVVAMLYNLKRDVKKDPDGLSWLDVYPEHREKSEPQTDEQMFVAMEMWAASTAHLKQQPS